MITRNATSRTLILHSVANYDALQVEHYRDQVRALIEDGYRHLIFDFERTEYVNSSALGMLVEFYNTVHRVEGTMRILNCNDSIRSLLRQTHLDKLFLRNEDSNERPLSDLLKYDKLHAIMAGEILLLTHIKDQIETVLRLEDPLEIGRAILEGVVNTVQSDRGVMFYLTQNQERLTLAHWIHRSAAPAEPRLTDYPLKFDKLEYEILRSEDVVVRHLEENDPNPSQHLLHSLGFRNLIAAPINGRLRQYGFLCVEADGDLAHMQIARPLLHTLTNICGMALEKAALLQQVNMQREELCDTVVRLRRSNTALQDAGKLAALGTIVSGLGHQMNNKLVPVLGYLQMILQQTDIPAGVMQKLTVVRTAADEIQRIVQKLVQVSGMRTFSRVEINPAERLQVALSLFNHQIVKHNITVSMEGIENSDVKLQGDPDLFLQALIAILHRAISSFPAECMERTLNIVERVEGDHLLLTFEDNGDAPNEEDQQECIDPLNSFEELQRGRIFNYTIPRGIIRRHKGNLVVQPGAAGGKVVTVELPLSGDITPDQF